ncbi:GntR family transcriptional regulator [Bosea sp. WAO]|uniref:GntR family transcriptional regulator n=1 Tax=Bosea sp. WAO TaxID=406341 RepID=UPI00082EECD7|nr:GntR family transcriptional regulator [Bosea sp. WAO]
MPDTSKAPSVDPDKTGGKSTAPRRAADSAERAYKAIRQQLVEFKMRPAERINEVHLAQMLDLSRTPVREALNRLASEGFVVFTPNRGFCFRGVDIDDLLDLFEMRSIIETGAFALACERADEAGIARLQAFWADARVRYENKDPDEILELDEGFHVHLAELANNPEIVRQLIGVNARIRFVRRVQIENGPQHWSLVEDHSRIVQAIVDRDRDRGIEILRSHISLTFAEARAVLKEALLKIFLPEQSAPRSGRARARK